MFKKRHGADKLLISQINKVSVDLKKANGTLSRCQDPLLLESTIYEIKYLQLRYAFLMKQAKESGISVNSFGASN